MKTLNKLSSNDRISHKEDHYNTMLLRGIPLLILTALIISGSETTVQNDVVHRSRRQLLWPNSTILQFNAGIGTPSPAERINVNWAFQANFQLPWNRTQIPFDILEANSGYIGLARRRRELEEADYSSDAKLCHFYKFVEEVFSGFGHDGTSCVLQTLCRLGAEPLHTVHEEDLLHDIASFVLNPINDLDHGLKVTDEEYRYIEAFKQGRDGLNCVELYNSCTKSLIDMFSVLHVDEI